MDGTLFLVCLSIIATGFYTGVYEHILDKLHFIHTDETISALGESFHKLSTG
jgi:hypothetical protein